MSRPKALTPLNLTQAETKYLIEKHPPQPDFWNPREYDESPPISLYLPDPERNMTKDDKSSSINKYSKASTAIFDDQPTKIKLALVPTDDAKISGMEALHKSQKPFSYNDRYDFYFPQKVFLEKRKYEDKELSMMEMRPPSVAAASEPNHYIIKPKKQPKKFKANKKQINYKSVNHTPLSLPLVQPLTGEYVPYSPDPLSSGEETSDIYVTIRPRTRFDQTPVFAELSQEDYNTGEYMPDAQMFVANTESIGDYETETSYTTEGSIQTSSESNQPQRIFRSTAGTTHSGERVEYQMHGFNGPDSYKFGFDTGKG